MARKGIDRPAGPALILRDPGNGQFFYRSIDQPAPTVMANGMGGAHRVQVGVANDYAPPVDLETGGDLRFGQIQIARFAAPGRVRRFSPQDLRRLCGFPDDFVLDGSYEQRWERLGRAVPPVMMAAVAAHVRDRILYPLDGRTPDMPPATLSKPPYRVPTMDEIRELPWNGYNAVSTFSGCGGSSLGYRMAGFRMLWASEFIPAARDSYRANAAPYTVLDGRDIREVQPADILTATGLGVGEIDLFDGSPPCASFSTAGKREAGWGKAKKYSDTVQRTDDLFYEYARLIEGTQPRVFVAENVSGLVKGTAKGYFMEIMRELKRVGYRVEAKLLDAQWLGVPQARQRLIFIGVRNDLGQGPAFPAPLPYRYTVRDALPWIAEYGTAPPHADYAATGRDVVSTMRPANAGASPTLIASGPNKGAGYVRPRVVHDTSGQRSAGEITDRPCPTVTVGVNSVNSHHYQVYGATGDVDPETSKNIALRGTPGVRRLTLAEVRQICGFPPDFNLAGTYEERWERMGRAVPPVMMSHVAATVRDKILTPLKERS